MAANRMANVMQLSLTFLVRRRRNVSVDFLAIILRGRADGGLDVFLAGTLKNSFDSEYIIGFFYFKLAAASFTVGKTADKPQRKFRQQESSAAGHLGFQERRVWL
jgi:hypothetical protein